jgi:mannose-6-phosphate isomerase-like protein (cupin superfamily)
MQIIYTAAVLTLLGACSGLAQNPPGRGEGRTVILQQAPTDKTVSISLEKLNGYYADMDAKKQQTLRMIEGGRFNVNIRRITDAETGLVHPVTADVWVVTQGSGTLTTGGKLEKGKIIGGESHPVKVGDVEFIPAALPHGVSGVTGSITWLNLRFDTNYNSSAPPAAEGRGGNFTLQAAPTDHAVSIPLEKLKSYYAEMDSKKQQTLRMLEGGRYNVNIRRITNAETALVHPDTADVWVVTEGGGTLTTGGKLEKGKIIGGESHPIKVGDVEFIPAGVPHGVSGVTGSITWLNIRYDTNYDK